VSHRDEYIAILLVSSCVTEYYVCGPCVFLTSSAKFNAKTLNQSENIPKSFSVATFFLKHPVLLKVTFAPIFLF